MSAPDILFVYPCHRQDYRPDSFDPYFGSSYLQAFLEQQGIRTRQFVPPDCFTLKEVVAEICGAGAGIIGFTCYDTNYYYVKLLAEAIKARAPQKKIILGGPAATCSAELIMADCQAVDACFRGEAEFSLAEFLCNPGQNPGKIEGLTYRQGDSIIRGKDRLSGFPGCGEGELDILPSPYLSGIIKENWQGSLALQTVRGCRFACTYCNFPGISGHRLRYFSIGRLLEELDVIRFLNKKLKKEVVLVYDDNFAGSKKRAKSFCRAILDAGIKLPLRTDIRVETLDRELIALMREIGFFGINIGLESAVPRVLRNINKILPVSRKQPGLIGHPNRSAAAGIAAVPAKTIFDPDYKIEKNFLQKVSRAVRWAKAENLPVSVSIIQGLPGEGEAEARRTLDFVEKLDVETYYHNQLKIFPGTKLFEDHRRFGIKVAKSASVLPYRTIPAYDLKKVPPGKNADAYRLEKTVIFDLFSHYWGVWNSTGAWSGGRYILFDGVGEPGINALRWMKDYLFLFDFVTLRSPFYLDREQQRETCEKMVTAGIPTRRIYFLLPPERCVPVEEKGEPPQQWILEYSSLYKPVDRFPALIKQVAPGFLQGGGEGSQAPRRILLLSFLAGEKETRNFIKRILNEGVDDLTKSLIQKGAWIEDGCRWAPMLCPAVENKRLIVDGAGGIFPCFSARACVQKGGCPTGGDFPQVAQDFPGEFKQEKWPEPGILKKRLREAMRRVEERRGCLCCPVKDTCLRCLYPFPFSAEEFCILKREKGVSERLINSFNINSYEWFKA